MRRPTQAVVLPLPAMVQPLYLTAQPQPPALLRAQVRAVPIRAVLLLRAALIQVAQVTAPTPPVRILLRELIQLR